MHGRLKVKTTEEQQAEKQKEREKKAKAFREVLAIIFDKRNKNELDEEILKLTERLLSSVPDICTLWNLRKETFLLFKDSRDQDEVETMLISELSFLQKCLHVNPKSYGVWHHRQFVMETMTCPDWKEELRLCAVFLSYDARNFHCWDYRRFIASKADVSESDELLFTTKKIEENFSNYSAWHYRSKLLPKVNPMETDGERMDEETLLKEMDLVQNAFFTDPNDQSAWFYERWLVGREKRNAQLLAITANRTTETITLKASFSLPVKIVQASAKVTANGTCVSGSWKTHSSSPTSHVWIFTGEFRTSRDSHVKVSLGFEDRTIATELQFASGESHSAQNIFAGEPRMLFKDVHSETKSSVLASQLESLEMLLEEEPDNKWTMLTMIHLMKAIDQMEHKEKIDRMMTQLVDADPYRKAYYLDLHSKLKIEYEIERHCIANDCFDSINLQSQKLTCLRHLHYFLTCKRLDISSNKLTSLGGMNALQNVEEINADGNNLENIDDIRHIPHLTKLSLRHNNLASVDSIAALKHCTSLTSLDIRNNPISETDAYNDIVREMTPSLTELNGISL